MRQDVRLIFQSKNCQAKKDKIGPTERVQERITYTTLESYSQRNVDNLTKTHWGRQEYAHKREEDIEARVKAINNPTQGVKRPQMNHI